MMILDKAIEEICDKDIRYKPDAYEFVISALHFAQKRLKRQGHLSAKELLDGIRQFAIEQYGPMVKAVFNYWGIMETKDFGNIVFNMIEKKLFSKSEEDSIGDFSDVYDFNVVFRNIIGTRCKKTVKKLVK